MQYPLLTSDIIKSGGEWISSVDLENAALNYGMVNEACVIGVRHEKWDERPIMFVTLSSKQIYYPIQALENYKR